MRKIAAALALSLLGYPLTASAQEMSAPEIQETESLSENYNLPFFKRPSAAGIHVGTQGLGLHYQVAISDQWSVKAGFGWMPELNKTKNYSSIDATTSLTASFANIHVLGEYRLFHRSPSRFLNSTRINFGLGMFLANEVSGLAISNQTLKYGLITLNKEDIGTLNASVKWNAVAPYLGFSFFQSIPSVKNLGLSADAGTYYIGKPQVTVTGTRYLEDNADLEAGLAENLNGYRWLPVLQLSLNYRINPAKKSNPEENN